MPTYLSRHLKAMTSANLEDLRTVIEDLTGHSPWPLGDVLVEHREEMLAAGA